MEKVTKTGVAGIPQGFREYRFSTGDIIFDTFTSEVTKFVDRLKAEKKLS